MGPAGRDTSIHDEIMPVDEARTVAREPDDNPRYVVGHSHSRKWLPRANEALEECLERFGATVRLPRIEAGRLPEDARECRTRRDTVHPHSVLAELDRDTACDVDQGRLRGRVAKRAPAGAQPSKAGDVDDAPRALIDHHWRCVLHRGNDADEMHAKRYFGRRKIRGGDATGFG